MFVDRGTNNWGTGNGESFLQDWLTLEYIREFVGEGQKFFYFKRRNMGFDNDYNGRKEVKVMTNPGIPCLLYTSYPWGKYGCEFWAAGRRRLPS